MYVSCSSLGCAKAAYPTVGDALGRIRELGFRTVDLAAFEGWQHVNPSELAAGGEAAIDELAGTIADSHLAVGSINCGMSVAITADDGEAFAQYRREFQALLALAGRIGCGNLTIQPGEPVEARDAAGVLSLVADRAGELGEMAKARGVSVGIEAHQGSILEDPAVAARMVAELCPAVGITYDPSHFAMQSIPLGETEALLARTVHVHVRNAAPGAMQATYADGAVDFDALIAALARHGYDGPVAIEYFNAFDADFASTLALRDRLVALGVTP